MEVMEKLNLIYNNKFQVVILPDVIFGFNKTTHLVSPGSVGTHLHTAEVRDLEHFCECRIFWEETHVDATAKVNQLQVSREIVLTANKFKTR